MQRMKKNKYMLYYERSVAGCALFGPGFRAMYDVRFGVGLVVLWRMALESFNSIDATFAV